MRLKNISKHFNKDKVYDGYSNAYLFLAHNSAHDDHSSSGATSRRRTMRTVPGTAPPARNVVKIYADYWLVGAFNTDAYDGAEVRQKYDLKKSTGLMTLLSPAAACAGSAGTDFHAQKEFYRDVPNPLTESDLDTMYNIFCPANETVTKGAFLRQAGRLYRVRNPYATVDGYIVAETDQLDPDALQTVVFTTNGARDLATDKRPVISTSVQVIQTDDSKFYRFADEVESDRKPGDRTVFSPTAALAVKVGATLTMLSSHWQVIAMATELDALALRVRLV